MTENEENLIQAYNAIAQNAALFRMAAALSDLKQRAQTTDQTSFWLEFGFYTPPPLFNGLPQGMPPTEAGRTDWKPLQQDKSRLDLFENSVKDLEPQHVVLLRKELSKIWARPGSGRKWLYFHPSLNREITLKVFEINGDRPGSVRRADTLVESMDNVLFGLLYFHGIHHDHWPCRRKGSKRKTATPTRSTG